MARAIGVKKRIPAALEFAQNQSSLREWIRQSVGWKNPGSKGLMVLFFSVRVIQNLGHRWRSIRKKAKCFF